MIVKAINDLIDNINTFSLKTYFPLSHDLIEDNNFIHKRLFNQKLKFNEEENSYYSKYIKNLKVEVFQIEDPRPNAFTIPGVGSISLLKHDALKYYTIGLEILQKHPLQASLKTKNKEIVFDSEIKEFKILVFITSGLMKRVPNIEDRFSIICHELGHWIYVDDIISNNKYQQMLAFVNLAILPSIFFSKYHITIETRLFVLSLMIIRIVLVSVTNFKSRASEYAADRFVKEMGRATNLQNALSLLEYNIDYHKLSDHFFLNIIIDIFDILFYPIVQYTHPPTHKRLEALKEDIDITFSLPDLINILNPLDKLIFQNNGLLCKF